LSHEVHPNEVKKFSFTSQKLYFFFNLKASLLIVVRKTIALFREQYETRKFTLLEKCIVFIVKADGADIYHSALKGY